MAQHEFQNLIRRVERYKEVLENTRQYREQWRGELRQTISQNLQRISEAVGLPATVELRTDIENLVAILLTLGEGDSGLGEAVTPKFRRDLVKHHGSLVYQQLFNGKVLVLINYPFIEKYGQPQEPKTLGIFRPHELRDHNFLRHVETFVEEITKWEDYDDDRPDENQRIGFKLNFEQPLTEVR